MNKEILEITWNPNPRTQNELTIAIENLRKMGYYVVKKEEKWDEEFEEFRNLTREEQKAFRKIRIKRGRIKRI